ncbi:MAG: cytochrome c maturation protein CcmE [Alphaproteobacteria bacterium]
MTGATKSLAYRRKRTRMTLVVCGLLFLGIATALTLTALEENITFFFGPSQVAAGEVPDGARFRIGGLVEVGSCRLLSDGVTHEFVVTDGASSVTVTYRGLLPSLFRDGQGIVALGHLGSDMQFAAEEVLAKHDETYIPAEAVEAMRQAGTWRDAGEEGDTAAALEQAAQETPRTDPCPPVAA